MPKSKSATARKSKKSKTSRVNKKKIGAKSTKKRASAPPSTVKSGLEFGVKARYKNASPSLETHDIQTKFIYPNARSSESSFLARS